MHYYLEHDFEVSEPGIHISVYHDITYENDQQDTTV
jgi:hypothetical protein